MKSRKVHIDNEEWVYAVQLGLYGQAVSVNIYSPDKKLYRVKNLKDIDPILEYPIDEHGNGQYAQVKPGNVKDYIINKIINS